MQEPESPQPHLACQAAFADSENNPAVLAPLESVAAASVRRQAPQPVPAKRAPVLSQNPFSRKAKVPKVGGS